jgi:hypothetical protein
MAAERKRSVGDEKVVHKLFLDSDSDTQTQKMNLCPMRVTVTKKGHRQTDSRLTIHSLDIVYL